jgi:hypothetical protein
MQPVLIDRRQLVPKRFVEELDDFPVTLHNSLLSWRPQQTQLCLTYQEIMTARWSDIWPQRVL